MPDSEEFVFVDSASESEEIAEIEEWLQPTDHSGQSSEFQKHLNSLIPGTGDWIEQIGEYRRWYDSFENGTLWTKAAAGAGKSVLAARLIAQLQGRIREFLFCSFSPDRPPLRIAILTFW
jgi:hypothetical protein